MGSGLGQASAGELEGGVSAQVVEVIGVLVPTGNRQDAGEQDLAQRVHDPARIASIRDHRGELFGNAQPSGRLGEQQNAVVRCKSSAIEGGCELLASNRWKREREHRRIGHGGRGGLDQVKKVIVSTQSLSPINALSYARHLKSTAFVNKTG